MCRARVGRGMSKIGFPNQPFSLLASFPLPFLLWGYGNVESDYPFLLSLLSVSMMTVASPSPFRFSFPSPVLVLVYALLC